jgi:multiple sugar transport system substrate-binding protein
MHLQRKFLAGLLLLGAFVTACAKQPERKVEQLEEDLPPALLKIEVPEPDAPLFDALIAGFQADHPEVTIERVAPPPMTNMEGVFRYRAAGTADVVTASASISRNLLDLSPYIARDGVDLAPYGLAMDVIRTEGKLPGLPTTLMAMMIGYNKELAAAAGVKIPNGGWTWDEFRAVAKQLNTVTPEGSRPGLVYEMPEDLLEIYIQQKTGRPGWQADEETLREALSFFDTMINTDSSLAPVKRRDLQEPGVTTYLGREFTNGTVPLSPVFVTGLKLQPYEFPYDVVPVPSHRPNGRVSQGSFGLLAITSGSANPDLAWAFIKYAAGPEGAKQMARAGFLPVYNTPDWKQWLSENVPGVPEAVYSLYETKWVASVFVSGKEATRYQAYRNAANRVMSGGTRAEVAMLDWKEAVKKLE